MQALRYFYCHIKKTDLRLTAVDLDDNYTSFQGIDFRGKFALERERTT